MAGLSFYTVDERYIDYLAPYAPHLFHNAKKGQGHSRKYIGIVLEVNGFEYFAPLSSFKEKHRRMKNGLDFIKVGDYAVINLNCMFPVATGIPGSATGLLSLDHPVFDPVNRPRQNNGGDAAGCNDFPLLEPAKASAIQRTAEEYPGRL